MNTKTTEEVETKTTEGTPAKQPKAMVQNRVLFVILDTMFNSLTGFRRGKEIAVNLIERGLPGDRFIVLENSPIGGLKYIGGSELNNKQLVKKIRLSLVKVFQNYL